jgi:hypothetical protein
VGSNDGSASNTTDQRPGRRSQASRNALDAGLGKDLNLTLIAALLSVLIAFPTALITSRVSAADQRRQERREREREAIENLERAMLREIDATVKVVVEGLPATPILVQGALPSAQKGTPGAKLAMVDFVSAQRECEAAREAVGNVKVKDASKRVSTLNRKIVGARSELEAEKYNPELIAARKQAIEVINETLAGQ